MWKINGICETGRSFRRLLSSVPPPKKSPVLIQIARLFRRSRSVKVAAAFLLLYKWSVQMTLCTGPSMEPTIHNGDIILVNKLVNLYDTYKHGDIVICVSPSDPGTLLCKRIMGGNSRERFEFFVNSIECLRSLHVFSYLFKLS